MNNEWQPISTAPKDHGKVLVYGKYGELVAFLDVTWTWWPFPAVDKLGYMPTHWMKLPEPPKA